MTNPKATPEEITALDDYILSCMWNCSGILFPNGNAQLGGAYSMFLSAGDEFREKYARVTTDLDFNSRELSSSIDIERFRFALQNELLKEGVQLKMFRVVERESSKSIKLSAVYKGVSSHVLKIDISLYGYLGDFGFTSWQMMLARKISVASKVVDRRPKDKSDIIALIKFKCNGHIRKGDIFNLLDLSSVGLGKENKWINPEEFASCLVSIRNFKPQHPFKGISSITMVEVMAMVRELFIGLYDERISDEFIFSVERGWISHL